MTYLIIFLIFLLLKNTLLYPLNTKFRKRDYSSLNEIALLNDIQLINWNEVLQSDSDPDEMFDSFHDKISQVIDSHVPIKQLSKKELNVRLRPWITPAIRISIQKENRIYKKYLKTRSIHIITQNLSFIEIIQLNHLLKISKINYYDNYFLSKSANSRDIWKGIKDLVRTKSQKYRAPTNINDNGLELNDPKSIANAFNNFFSTIGSNLASKVPYVQKSPTEYMISSSSDNFFLFPTTAGEIENVISKSNNSKSTGPFSIPIPILKLIKNVLSGPLETIFNASFSTGIVPKSLKIAKVLPVFKKGLCTKLNNYRPISLLNIGEAYI
jgi:hypothetical protein